MVSIKFSNSGIPPILAATLRSILASALLWAYAWLKGERVFFERADLPCGLVPWDAVRIRFSLLGTGERLSRTRPER